MIVIACLEVEKASNQYATAYSIGFLFLIII